MQQLTIKPCLKAYIYIYIHTKEFEIWYVIYYKLNEMHDDFIVILEEVLNFFNYLYQKEDIVVLILTFFNLFLYAYSQVHDFSTFVYLKHLK